MYTPIAGILAVRAARSLTDSALPDAPVTPDPPETPNLPASRRSLAGALRLLARRSSRLADRLEPQRQLCA